MLYFAVALVRFMDRSGSNCSPRVFIIAPVPGSLAGTVLQYEVRVPTREKSAAIR